VNSKLDFDVFISIYKKQMNFACDLHMRIGYNKKK
jgi:hypothetical protein